MGLVGEEAYILSKCYTDSVLKNGDFGLSPEELEEIYNRIDSKADVNHRHDQDTDFSILATQVVETNDRKFVSKNEKEALSGVSGNIQSQINILKLLADDAMKFKGKYSTYADMLSNNQNPKVGDTVFIDCDENNSNLNAIYYYLNSEWMLVKKDQLIEAMKFKGRYTSHADMLLKNPTPTVGDTTFIDQDETQDGASTIYYYTGKSWLRIKKDSSGDGGGWVATNIAPPNKKLLWIDISKTKPALKWYNGASWEDLTTIVSVPAGVVKEEKDLHFVDDRESNILKKISEDKDTGLLMYDGSIIGGGASSNAKVIDDSKVGIDTTFSSFKLNEELKNKQASLGFIPEDSEKKGKANGYVPLDGQTKIGQEYLYKSHFVVSDEETRLALTDVQDGNICYEESTTKFFVYSAGVWKLLAKGDSLVAGKNNFAGTRNPLYDDDSKSGYLSGSIWINKHTKKAFICTDSTPDAAVWEVMAGQVTMNIAKIVPFTIDSDTLIIDGNKYKYLMPEMDINADFVELSRNGLELELNKDYRLEAEESTTYVVMDAPISEVDSVFGEIYQHDFVSSEERMTKSVYDSNNNGKVDFAEMSDIAKGLATWRSETLYDVGEIVLVEDTIYICNTEHLSGSKLDEEKWTLLTAKPINLDGFTTDDLEETDDKKYMNVEEKINVEQLPFVFEQVNTLIEKTDQNTADIVTLTDDTEVLKDRMDNLKFVNLLDTPSSLQADSYLKIDETGEFIIQEQKPRFPITTIIDSTGTTYTDIETPIFKNMEMIERDEDQYTFALHAEALELIDMPDKHEHGKVLVSDENNQKFILADKEDLTMSIENFTHHISIDAWDEGDDMYEYIIEHDMSSEALVVSFVNELKIEDKDVTYEILDNSSIKVLSEEPKDLKCTINCSLGAGNGYWQYLMDWTQIDFVDDARIREDRAYSSKKVMEVFKDYALKADYYTKAMTDAKFADIKFAHEHDNASILDDLDVNVDGDLTFQGTRLLTEINPILISLENIFNESDFKEIYDIKSLYKTHQWQTLLASEILVQNISKDEAVFKIKDGGFDLVTVTLEPNEVQKYHLGISNKTKVIVKGNVKTQLTISAL